MSLLFTVLVVVVVGAIVVVAAGRGAPMTDETVDRPDLRLPTEGPLTAADLRGVRFGTALRGYRASEVDDLLERLARELEQARGDAPADSPPAVEPHERTSARAPYQAPPPPAPHG